MATNNYEREIQKTLTNSYDEKLSQKQMKTLKKYYDFYSNKKSSKGGIIKPATVWNVLMVLRLFGVYLSKPYEDATKQNIIDYFTKHLKGKAESTLSAWKVIIRSFYKWKHGMRKKHEFPDVVDDERLEPTKAKPRNISPGDLLTKDEIIKMLEHCYSPQDKAIVSIWFEMGIRSKEYVSANIDSVEFVSGGCKFYVEKSKTEEGFVPLLQSAPYLQEWLQAHPLKGNPKAPLFVSLKHLKGGMAYKRLQPNAINQKLKRIAVRAGIKKRIFTHLGRNMSITRLDGTITVEDNARLHGITSSTVLNVYTRRNRKDAVKKYFDVFGKEKTPEEKVAEKKEKEKLLPKICENCGTSNGYERHYCLKCLRPIDIKTFIELDDRRQLSNKVVLKTIEKKQVLSKDIIKEVLREMIKNGEIEF